MDLRRSTATAAALVGLAAAGTTVVAGPAQAAGQTGKAIVNTRTTRLGTFLVDAKGRTLYLFEKDKKNVSKCSGSCLGVWPADLVSGSLKAKGKASPKLLGTIKRADGSRQLTYRGHPLYTYVGDPKAGTTAGQGVTEFGANWYVVTPAGSKIDND